MRKNYQKLTFPISILLALLCVFGPASQALAQAADNEKVPVIISFKEKPGSPEKDLIQNAGGKVKREYNIVRAIAASVPRNRLDGLRNNNKVASVDEDIALQAVQVIPWGVDRIDAETVHGQFKGDGVKVAILDTGIDLDHPDLRVAGNVSFVEGVTTGDDDNGHGTMVAGIVAALDNETGVVGVAPGAELFSVKVLDKNGVGFCSDILSGLEWAMGNGIQVVNMSFGTSMNLPLSIQQALDTAYMSGMVLVSGSGNSGDTGIVFSPARYNSVIAVGATDEQNARASFSSTGPSLELAAPGVGISTTTMGGGYGSGSGTSFSTPHVTGIAALLISAGMNDNLGLRQVLRSTAADLGAPGWDNWYGFGLASAAKAVEAAVTGGTATGNTGEAPADSIPPITKIMITGLKTDYKWYRSDVTVTLSAVDNAGGSGVADIRYSLDAGAAWMTYQEPFAVSREGATRILVLSTDRAGNSEAFPNTAEVWIDKTGPEISISATPDTIWPANNKVEMIEIALSATAGDVLSGLKTFHFEVIDEYGLWQPEIRPILPARTYLEASREGSDKDGRVYTIRLIAVDYADNTSTAETYVTVSHDQGKKEVGNEKTK